MKAKNLIATSKILVEEYEGEVPQTMEALTRLPGVGRKTANVVLSNAFGIPGLAVDTHVFRVSHRAGPLKTQKTPKGRKSSCAHCCPPKSGGARNHWLIYHGRRVCHAKRTGL